MKKNGFTLIEMLAVIVVLGILMGLAVVGYTGIKANITDTYYKGVEETVLMSASEYFTYNENLIPQNYGEIKKISLSQLIEKKYTEEVVDQQGKNCDTDNSYVMAYKDANDKVKYAVCLKCGDEYDSTGSDECQGKVDLSIQTRLIEKNTLNEYVEGKYTNSNVLIEVEATTGIDKVYVIDASGNIKKHVI